MYNEFRDSSQTPEIQYQRINALYTVSKYTQSIHSKIACIMEQSTLAHTPFTRFGVKTHFNFKTISDPRISQPRVVAETV